MLYIYGILFSFKDKIMDNIKEAFDRIATLDAVGIGLRQPEAVRHLNDVYSQIFGTTIDSGCEGCLRKAFGKLQLLTLEKLTEMSESKFKLKAGIVLPFGEFGSGEYLTKDNLTDNRAYEQLNRFPGQIEYFEKYPQDKDGNLLPLTDDEIIEKAAPEPKVEPLHVIIPTTEEPKEDTEAPAPGSTIVTDVNGVKVEANARKHISKITKDELKAEYKELFGEEPNDELSKGEINEAILSFKN